jgi:trk system potassium uptake protein
MIDIRPITYVVGRILIVFAILMLAPAIIDYRAGLQNGLDFLQCAILTGSMGALLALATQNSLGRGLDTRQAYVLTAAIWGTVPLFGALPFYLGDPHLTLTDAYFEAVSGITGTGTTVIVGLDALSIGTNLWRGLLNWLGGLGIVFVAMIFLPLMRVGGMQYFRTEGFDTFGKAMPRATDIAKQLLYVYAGLTVICGVVYTAIGMSAIDAIVHAMATISTGGFSPSDTSFNKYAGAGEYAGVLFMILASLPFLRYVQLVSGAPLALWRDVQVRGFLRILVGGVVIVTAWRAISSDATFEPAFRQTLFNLTSILSGTGFFTGDFFAWGGFAMIIAFVMGLIGGCSGSSAGALTVFRVQVSTAALLAQIRLISNPNRISPVKYGGRTVQDDVLNSLILFVTSYVLIIGVLTVAMSMVGVASGPALFGVWASLGNIGYHFAPLSTDGGTAGDFPQAAKLILILAMLMGRLGLLAVLVLVLPRFWRA